jgi:multiple sugar transport system substrate-binding protein
MKRFLLTAAALMLIAALVACGGGGSGGGNENAGEGGTLAALPPMTTAPVHLTFAMWDDIEHNQWLADQFTKHNPNITISVEFYGGTGVYHSNLLAEAAAGNMPDLWGKLELSTPIVNGWFYDFSEFWFNDPDVEYYLEALRPQGVIDGRAIMVVTELLPAVVYLDRAVFNRLNVPMPRFDWTYEEMLQTIEHMTRPDMGIFGYNFFVAPVTIAPIAQIGGQAEFGWDGQNLNLRGPWADALNWMAQARRLGWEAQYGSAEWEALTGDAHLWPGVSGRIAMQLDAFWTLSNIYLRDHYRIERGLDMIPYTMPKGANSPNNNKIAWVDFAAISAGTRHPREAYEVLKWMSFMPEAWMYRMQDFPTRIREDGELMYLMPNHVPTTNDQAVWDKFFTLLPIDPGDQFMHDAWEAFLRYCREPVTWGGRVLPGFDQWVHEIYHNGEFNGVIGIEAAVFEGLADAHDFAADLEASFRPFYDTMMAEFRLWMGPPRQ